jgi:hypothetical protein
MQRRGVGVEVYRPCGLGVAFPRECARRAGRQRSLAAQVVRIERKTGLDSTLPDATVSPGAAPAHSHHLFSKSFYELWAMRLRINLLRLLGPPPWSVKHKINDPQNGPRRQHSITVNRPLKP